MHCPPTLIIQTSNLLKLSPLHWSSDSFDSEGQFELRIYPRYRDRVETKLNRLRQLDNSDRQSQRYIVSVTFHSSFNRIWRWFMAPFQFSSELQHTWMLHDNHREAFFFDSPFNKKLVPHHNLRTSFLGEEYFANPLHRIPPFKRYSFMSREINFPKNVSYAGFCFVYWTLLIFCSKDFSNELL